MTQHAPRRLLDDPSVDARLRRDLENARNHVEQYDVRAGLEALAVTLDALGPASAAPTRAGRPTYGDWTASLKALATKWWGWSAVGLSTVGAMWWLQREAPAHTVEARAASVVESTLGEIDSASFEDSAEVPAEVPVRVGAPALAAGHAASERPARVAPALAAGHAASERPARAAPTKFDRASERAHATPARSTARVARGSSTAMTAETPRAGTEPQTTAARVLAPSMPRASEPSPTRADTALPSRDPHAGDAALVRSAAPPAPHDAPSAAQARATPATKPGEAEVLHAQEIEHLARVRRLLTKKPQRALEAAREGQARFAGGLFAEERAALIVFALAKLDRKRETLLEARNFLRAYPSGPFVARVRAIAAELEGQGL